MVESFTFKTQRETPTVLTLMTSDEQLSPLTWFNFLERPLTWTDENMHRKVAQVTGLCLQQPYKEREVMLLNVCFENISLKGACDFPAAMCCSHIVFKRRNVIFRCHILISKIQTKFLTITPTFIQRANRVHNDFTVVYLRVEHIS